MNPIDELKRMVSMFPASERLLGSVEHVASALTPEPYKTMLVHEHHMTVTMERWHGCPVQVRVLDRHSEGDVYARKIVLLRTSDGQPVQFGLVRFRFEFVTPAVRDEILAERTPLGRVLINHNVLRHIDLGAILRIEAGPELGQLLAMPEGGVTYGRLATIFCNGAPAVDLLEVTAPLQESLTRQLIA